MIQAMASLRTVAIKLVVVCVDYYVQSLCMCGTWPIEILSPVSNQDVLTASEQFWYCICVGTYSCTGNPRAVPVRGANYYYSESMAYLCPSIVLADFTPPQINIKYPSWWECKVRVVTFPAFWEIGFLEQCLQTRVTNMRPLSGYIRSKICDGGWCC